MGARWRLRRGGWLALAGSLAAVAAATGGVARADTGHSVDARDLPPELSATNASGPVITPQQAVALVNAYWPLRERALAADDQKTTDLLEDGVAREYDDAVTVDDRSRGGAGAGLRHVRAGRTPTVFVPRQLSYPAAFMAAVSTEVYAVDRADAPRGQPWYIELVIFTRRDARSRWMASYDTGYQTTNPGPPAAIPVVDDQGFDADPLVPGWVDPTKVHGMLADYWQHWKNTGGAPPNSPFQAGYWTTQRGTEIGKAGQDRVQASCDCYSHVEYRTDPNDGRWQFAWRSFDGSPPRDIVCSTVRIRDAYTPQAGRLLHQTDDRNNWGGWLKPGYYRSLDIEDVRQSCIEIGPTQADGLLVAGGNGETLNVTGVKANVPVPPTLKLPRSSWLRNLLLIQGFLIAAAAITVSVLVIVLQQRARVSA